MEPGNRPCLWRCNWRTAYIRALVVHVVWSVVASRRKVPMAVILPYDDTKWFSMNRVKPAVDIALKKTSMYLHDTQLTVKYADSKCHIAEPINEAINFYMKGDAYVFFGPCCDYAAAPIARQIRYWNLPMLTAGAMAGDFGVLKLSTFPLLTRVGPDFNSLARFVFSFVEFYKWHKVKLVYQPNGQESVIERFCHLAADGLHNGILNRQQRGGSYRIEHDYFKFLKTEDILDKLPTELGNSYSGERLSSPAPPRLVILLLACLPNLLGWFIDIPRPGFARSLLWLPSVHRVLLCRVLLRCQTQDDDVVCSAGGDLSSSELVQPSCTNQILGF